MATSTIIESFINNFLSSIEDKEPNIRICNTCKKFQRELDIINSLN